MMKQIVGLLILCVSLVPIAGTAALNPEASVVEIEVTKKVYDYRTPWITRNQQVRKNGILIGPNQILTTADGLSAQYLCRVKKGGESRQYTAEVSWVDYYANVAILSVPELAFREGMRPVALAKKVPQGGEVQIYRWREGRIEERAAEIVRLYSGTGKLSYVQHLILTISSPISSAGWSEIVFNDDQLVGLTASASKDTLTVLPSTFIAKVIERKRTGTDPGLGYFDFEYMSAKNPDLLASKGLDARDVGVVVTEIGTKGLTSNYLQVGDVILEVDDFEIDSEGMYIDPDYGRLSMRRLATRGHAAGEYMPFKVWRDGIYELVYYTLPQADFEKGLIPENRYDGPPRYLIEGGFVFQPLDGPLLRALGNNKPVLLDYYSEQDSIEGRDGLVVLSVVLPDDYNLGYEEIRYVLVDRINGLKIESLDDVTSAFERSRMGFHQIRFMPEERVQHVVLDAEAMSSATERILRKYRIPSKSHKKSEDMDVSRLERSSF